MSKPLPRYHSTTIAPARTAAQLGEILTKYGVSSYTIHLGGDREPVGVSFTMPVAALGDMGVPVTLSPRIDELARRLPKMGTRYNKEVDWERAKRVGWRQLMALIELQLEAVDTGLREFHELFLADIMQEGGKTVGQLFVEQSGKLLGPGRAG